MKVTNGHNVSVHYKGTLSDGTEFDNSRTRGSTINFEVGSGRMIRGFNDAVVGMTAGETKSVTLTPETAYGPRNEEAFQKVPREAFGPDFEFIVGGTIQGNGPAGPFLAKIFELQDDHVVLDMNHPLAGQHLNFEIEVVSVDGEGVSVNSGTWTPKMKKAELLEFARARGLDVNTRTTKKQLIAALQG
jgi:peptidylprolyl isomerase